MASRFISSKALYSKNSFYPFIVKNFSMNSSKEFLYLSNDHSKVRLVFDQYIKRSLKSRTRQHLISRKQVQYKVTNSTDINNTTFKKFLSHSDTKHQCKTVRQGIVRYRFVHFSALFLYIFLHIFLLTLFSCRIFFTLHFLVLQAFCVALWSSCIISYCKFPVMFFFRAVLIPCCTFSRGTLFSCGKFFVFYFFSCCFMLHFFAVALFSGCTFFVLFFFHVAPFFVLLHVKLFSCCYFLCYTLFMLHFFRVAVFSCCFFLVWHTFRVALFPSVLHFFHLVLFSCCTFFRTTFFSY